MKMLEKKAAKRPSIVAIMEMFPRPEIKVRIIIIT
jgi:hypothetical protein